MSVLIRGMEMPKSCMKCRLSYLDPGCSLYCPLVEDDVGPDGQVDIRCPLVPVPPHGRLIDEDNLLRIDNAYYKASKDIGFAEYAHEVVVATVKAAPTIIEAEEGE